MEYREIEFEGDKGLESLLDSTEVASANVILIDSNLFKKDNVGFKSKFTGEEFRMILRKVFPFIEVVVFSQNGESKAFDIIPKYRSESSETATEYYERVLKDKIDECIERVIMFRNISRKLENNSGIEKFLVEKTVGSLNGVNDYEDLSKGDVDRLIAAFQSIGQE